MLLILRFFSFIYFLAVSFRNILFNLKLRDIYNSKLPVISVGNISVGGTGKTPLAIFLAKQLKSMGRKPVVISRGYKGTIYGPHLVTERDTYKEVGDEPLLISSVANVPVVIAKQRAQGARFVEKEKLGDVIILDDGFQHRALARDFDIVCVDASSEGATIGFFSDSIMPAGRLREGLYSGIRRADYIIFSLRQSLEKVPAYVSYTADKYLGSTPWGASLLVHSKVIRKGEELTPQPIFAFCGIANPAGFKQSLEHLGFEIRNFKTFPDHYTFNDSEIAELLKLSESMPLVCTPKDFVRLPNELAQRVYALHFDLAVEGNLLASLPLSGNIS